MMTVHEVSKLAGVSIRTLQYYDKIGLLHPTGYTDAGYRLYDDADLERLQHILLFRELEFPLKDIRDILNSPDFDRSRALEQQIELLKLKKTAFLASSTISSETVLRCYDWATEMRNRGECVVSGFSSKLEQDVLHFLLKGNQPIIVVLARRMYRKLSPR